MCLVFHDSRFFFSFSEMFILILILACAIDYISTSQLPFLNFFTVLGFILLDRTFSFKKGESFAKGFSSSNAGTRNLGNSIVISFSESESERQHLLQQNVLPVCPLISEPDVAWTKPSRLDRPGITKPVFSISREIMRIRYIIFLHFRNLKCTYWYI